MVVRSQLVGGKELLGELACLLVGVWLGEPHAQFEARCSKDAAERVNRRRAPPGLVGGDGGLAGASAVSEILLGEACLTACHSDQVT